MVDGQAQGGQNVGGSGDEKIKIDDKEYSKSDIKNILTNAESVTKKATEVSRIIDAAKSFDLSPEEFLEQATGSFSVINTLIEKGVIDRNGKLVEKGSSEPDDLDDLDTSKLFNGDISGKGKAKGTESSPDVAALVDIVKELAKRLDTINKQVADTDKTQTSIIRQNLSSRIKANYPNLTDEDVSKVFVEASIIKNQGKKVDLDSVAKTVADRKKEEIVRLEKDYAIRHGLNYDELAKMENENNLDEKSKDGGLPASIKGKTFSFKKKGDGFVTPRAAMKTFFQQRFSKENR
jgi:hypothetical protein